ncbi:hypothetical protein NE848_14420 [Gramella jeungdoensis]|uniref:Histidine kinase N-terminal 7TM region domain-containing protein n=1 Tax=Gramella jeungdoensis TaxID=708091 RepID=A0ABT0Z4C1_9FLAO|nr:hypothetical protein [Gramella jeungdoensis]MCM8570587.1 hypothetical protein [Gramella jeungdoensis]
MWETFIEYRLYPTYIFELIAAISGIFYLYSKKKPAKADKLIVFTINLIFVIDLFAIIYSVYYHVYDYAYIEFIKETPFRTNLWIYNILTLVTGSLFTVYFLMQTQSGKLKKAIGTLVVIYIISSIIHFFTSDVFFLTTSAYVYIYGAFLICISIAAYYLELVRTERILNFRRELPLYISIGLIIYQLGITPLFIFQRYVGVSEDFSEVYGNVLDLANFFMYSVFAFGFLKVIFEIKRSRRKALN